MIRNEMYSGGVVVSAEIVDLTSNTIAFEVKGTVQSTRALTAAEIANYNAPINQAAGDTQILAAMATLRAYRDLGVAPTLLQTTAVVKILCRVVLNMARRQYGQFDSTD